MSHLVIQASTPLCLLQDAGRFGVRHLGVTQGGAAPAVPDDAEEPLPRRVQPSCCFNDISSIPGRRNFLLLK